jgi:hypothetical protein
MEVLVLSGFSIVDVEVFERHYAVLQFRLVKFEGCVNVHPYHDNW